VKSIALALLLLAAPVSAQKIVTVGSDTTAAYSLESLRSFHNISFQSFVVPEYALTLNSFSFWWGGFTMDPEGYFVRVGLNDSTSANGRDDRRISFDPYELDGSYVGWYTFHYNRPVTPGERLFFWFVAGDGSPYAQIPEKFAHVKLSDQDAYSDGWYGNGRSDYAYSGADPDMLFRATYTTVTPEPMTVILLGSGLAGIAAARRRKKEVD